MTGQLKAYKQIFLAIIFVVSIAPIFSDASPTILSDRPDKDFHALAGLSICYFVAGVASNFNVARVNLVGISLSAAVLSGIAKELVDLLGTGTPEFKDFFNTVIGERLPQREYFMPAMRSICLRSNREISLRFLC